MRRQGSGGLVVGLILVGLGILLLLDASDTVDFGTVWSDYWPVLLIAWGGLAIQRERGRSLVGTIVLLLGVGFLLENLGVFADDWLSKAWPVAIIVFGLSLVIGSLAARSGAPTRAASGPEPTVSSDWIDVVAALSGRKESVTNQAWRGGRVTVVMGGLELDLRNAKPVAGGATIRCTAFMGGIEIRVPHGWAVALQGTPLLGGFHSKAKPPADPADAPRLVVTGTAIMGGVEIKH
jgi:predicted membrane protein